MKAKSIITTGLLTAMALSISLNAQMNLCSFYSQSTRTGYSVFTSVDSLFINTKVNSGCATTRVTMVVRPGLYQNHYYNSSTGTYDPSGMETPLDSLEISQSFTLPTDFVADSMWLWVNGKPVEAYIQDRTLAESQYAQIVNRRRDPAILSYNGGGYYNLRIFPASSNVGRKIAIQFHHTFDDDSITAAGVPCATARLPFTYDTSGVYNYYSYVKKPVAFMQVTGTAGDLKTYSLSIPGLGTGTFSRSNPLVLSGKDLWKAEQGCIAGEDPSGTQQELLWTGFDLKSAALTAGFTTKISDKNLTFLPEPAARIIVLDMRASVWNWNDYYRLLTIAMGGTTYNPYYYYTNVAIAERARKYAILAIQSYVEKGQNFNVIIAGKTAQRVFSSPVRGTADNKRKAIAAVLAATPDSLANTFDALREAVNQAPEGISLLISDLLQPGDYTVKTGLVAATSTAGKSYDTTMRRIDSLVNSAPAHTLFSINDNWKLGDIALKSGGYVIGGLRNGFNIPYTYDVVNGSRVLQLAMSPLFGSANPTGLTRLEIMSSDLDDMVFTLEGSGTGYFYAPLLRVAGRTTIEKFKSPMAFRITGKLGGLRFIRNIAAGTDYRTVFSSYRPDEDVQWAWRKSEWLAATDYQANAAAVKAIGKEYHIITKQTSLLALEPGMTLWNDTVNQTNQSTVTPTVLANPTAVVVQDAMIVRTIGVNAEMVGGAPYSYVYYGSGFNIDSIPMQTISGVGILLIYGNNGSASKSIQLVSITGKKVMLRLPLLQKNSAVVSLYNLTGRRIAARTVDAPQCTGSNFTWDLQKEAGVAAHGQYVLRVTVGTMEQMFRIMFFGK
jgi:hypothetical protein